MKKLIVFGSLNTDLTIQCDQLPVKGETIRGSDFLINVGGKGCNQAIGAAKSGCEVKFIGGVGEDLFGEKILNTLKQSKIDAGNIQILQNQRTGVAVIIRSNGDNRIILDSGANYTLDVNKAEKAIDQFAVKGDIFLTQFENQYDTVKFMLKKAKRLGLYTILNPTPVQFIEREVYQYIDMIIINQSETKTITGIYPDSDETCIEAFKVIKSNGAGNCIITLGSAGSVTILNGKLHKVSAYDVEIIDTTAAGDAYIGALISKMVKDMDLVECMDYASKVSSLTITKTGAQQSIPYISEVEKYFKKGGE
jgi:ribokinase